MSSINDKLDRVRKPRVHIKYDVETEGGEVSKELPFTVAAIGDYAGTKPGVAPKPLKDRKFINIDRDNFDSVMESINPGVQMRVENTLEADGTEMNVQLDFKRMDDFEPDQLVERIKPLKELKDIRDRLSELLTKTDVSDELESLLEKVLKDPSAMEELAQELGVSGDQPKE